MKVAAPYLLFLWTQVQQPIPNPSFETLGPNGFPEGWNPVGTAVEISSDAYSGERAIRFSRHGHGIRQLQIDTRHTQPEYG